MDPRRPTDAVAQLDPSADEPVRPSLAARVLEVLDKVGTRPHRSAYEWGGRLSVLAFVVFHLIWLGRCFSSPLQWCKYFYRRWAKTHATTNVRRDFPARYTELYFLLVLSGGCAVYLVDTHTNWTAPPGLRLTGTVVGYVLLVETFLWIVYYLATRTFVERSYTIYHPAEYFLNFPLVLAVQVFLIRDLTGRPIGYVVDSLTGHHSLDDRLSVALGVVGIGYLAVAIIVLLSSHPGIRTRNSQNVTILGAGDVVRERIVPALLDGMPNFDHGSVLVLTPPNADEADELEKLGERVRLIIKKNELMEAVKEEGAPTVIASPTFAHFRQLVEIAAIEPPVPFAVEKPITMSPAERDILRAQGQSLMKHGFALSYYTLEKALPLTYFLSPLPAYEPFLASDPPELMNGSRMQEIRDVLGQPVDVDIALLEGVSRSPTGASRLWTEVPSSLRPFVETAIHPLLILRHVIGTQEPIWRSIELGRYGPRAQVVRDTWGREIAPTFLTAHGEVPRRSGQAAVRLKVGKYIPEAAARRDATLLYEHGCVHADFDARTVDVKLPGEPGPFRVMARNDVEKGIDYGRRYVILMSMFAHFALTGTWHGARYDDFDKQLDALDWWDSLCSAATDVNVDEYGDEGPRGL